jgi:hypothetical protein
MRRSCDRKIYNHAQLFAYGSKNYKQGEPAEDDRQRSDVDDPRREQRSCAGNQRIIYTTLP